MKAAVIGKMTEQETGSIFLRGRIWWVRYLRDGAPFLESSGSQDAARAEKLLAYRIKNGIKIVEPDKTTRNLGGRKRQDKKRLKPRVFSSQRFDPSTGGKASAAAKLRKQDFELRRKAQAFAVAANLPDGRYRPLLTTLARISILLERTYQHLKNREDLLKNDGSGELISSIDTVRKLAISQVEILKTVGLTPNSLRVTSNGADNSELEQALVRIDSIKRVREAVGEDERANETGVSTQ